MSKKEDKISIDVSLEELMEAGCHFGHQARRWHPKMAPYIWGEKDGVHIFDLDKTRKSILEAVDMVRKLAQEGKSIIFVGTKNRLFRLLPKRQLGPECRL